MKKFKHSGSFSDIVYSLPLIRLLGGGDIVIHLNNLGRALTDNGTPLADITSEYRNKLSQNDFDMLLPLLKRQPYISNAYVNDGYPVDYDLDLCKGYLYRKFRGNHVEAYYKCFGIEYTTYQVVQPWLVVDNYTFAPVIVNRTARHRSRRSDCDEIWRNLNKKINFKKNALFVGTEEEYGDFISYFGFEINYYHSTDFHAMAGAIAGADLFIGNQGFAYSLAQGLGKPTICETVKDFPLLENDCYFKREGSEYF